MAFNAENELRIAEMMAVMREWKWKRGKSAGEYAKKYGIHVDNAEKLSAEAWKRVKAEVCDPDATTAEICLSVIDVIQTARAVEADPAAEWREKNAARKVIVDAAKAWASVTIGIKESHEFSLKGAVTPAAAREALKEHFRAGVDAPDAEGAETEGPLEGSAGGTRGTPEGSSD